MGKSFVRTLTVLALVGGTAVVSTAASAATSSGPSTAAVKKLAVQNAIYKIEAVEGTVAAPVAPGCLSKNVKCPTSPPMKTNLPSLVAQEDTFADIAGATKIDTFASMNVPMGGSSTPSGCAIVSGGLKCWGSNSSGQLGTGNTTDVTSPTNAVDNGQPLVGITDLSTNGSTTCVIDDGAVRCVGSGNLNSLKTVTRSITGSVTTNQNGSSSTASLPSRCETDLLDSSGNVVSSTAATTTFCGSSSYTVTWQTIVASGAKKVQVGSSMASSTPSVCVLMQSGRVDCLLSATSNGSWPPSQPSTSNQSVTAYDCDSNSADFESTNPCGGSNYRVRYLYTTTSEYEPVTLNWQSVSGITGAVDISMPSDSWGSSQLCIATPASATCRSFSNGTIGKATTIKGSEGAEAVWMTSGWGPTGLCVYASGTMKCGSGSYTSSGQSGVTAVSPVAVMEKPLSVFYGSASGSSGTLSKLYFLLPSGILSADSWIFSCNSCYSSSTSKVVPVTAFSEAAAKSFLYLSGVTGGTDNADFLPLAIGDGARASRSSVLVKISAGGEPLSGSSVTWMAPDFPGQYQSSSSSNLKTDGAGAVRMSLVSGPVTFTLSGGAVSSGAVALGHDG